MDHEGQKTYGSVERSSPSSLVTSKEHGLGSQDSTESSNDSWSCSPARAPQVVINRNALSEADLESWAVAEEIAYKQVTDSGSRLLYKRKAKCCCSPKCTDWFKRRVPVLSWLPNYSPSKNLMADAVAGFTVAIMQVPQGMAYAMLANVPPVVGLYTSFFPALIYFIFGTSRHGSIGTFALTSMLTNTAMEDVLGALRESFGQYSGSHTNFESNSTGNSTLLLRVGQILPPVTPDIQPIDVAVVVAFLVGIMQLSMAIARLGSLTVLMSDQMISGLITGTAVQVLTSQLQPMTGAHIEKFSGVFSTIMTWFSFLGHITTINLSVLLVSVSSISFLMLVKYLIDPVLVRKIKIPFPAELVLVILGTVLSMHFCFKDNFNIAIIGPIPTGLATPKMPHLQLIPKLLTGGTMVAIICVSLSLSIVMSYSKKHSYPVDSNQELLAYGMANMVSSFFSCIPCSISLSRSAVLDSSGGKSQISMLISCIFLLIVIIVLGPLFSSLPDAVLSSIIVVALRSMLAGVTDLLPTWKTSKSEAMVWLLTFLGAIVLDIDYGLGIGILASLLCVLYHAHRPSSTVLLGHLEGTELYVDKKRFRGSAREVQGVKIIRLPGPLYFGNRDSFRSQIDTLARLNSNGSSGNLTMTGDLMSSCSYAKDGESALLLFKFKASERSHHLVLDCSAISFIDSGGVGALVQLAKDLKKRNSKLMLAALQDGVQQMILNSGILDNTLSKSSMFPTIHDAVLVSIKESSATESESQSEYVCL